MDNGYAGRDKILAAAASLKTIEVDVPRLGGKVRLREMGAYEKGLLEDLLNGEPADSRLPNARAFYIMCSVVDDEGNLLFGKADLPALNRLPGLDASILCDKITELSLIGSKAIEDAAKNSESDRKESPSSASPGRSDSEASA